MKKSFVLLFILVPFLIQAQEKRKNIAIHYGIGEGAIFMRKNMVGGPALESKTLNTIGFGYWHEIDKNLFIETGLNYIDHSYTITSSFYPGIPQTITTVNAPLLTIPIKLRYEFSKYFFANGGAFVGLALKKTDEFSSQQDFSGIGASIGLGASYSFAKNLSIYANPQFNAHRILASTKKSNYQLGDFSLLFGLAYQIK